MSLSLPAFAVAIALHLSNTDWLIRPFLAAYFVALLRFTVARDYSRVFAGHFNPSSRNISGLLIEISAYVLAAAAILTVNFDHTRTVVSCIFTVFGLLLVAELVPDPGRRVLRMAKKPRDAG
jgi:hypothetical protein